MSTFPLDQDVWKSDPQIMVYKVGDHKLTYSTTFEKHQFGYTGDDYFNLTFEHMRQKYGLTKFTNK